MALTRVKKVTNDSLSGSITVDKLDIGQIGGRRNMIINGAMNVAQRGTQTNQTSAYTACDRFEFTETGATVVTTSQDTTVPSGQGFTSSLKIDVTTADSSLASGDFVVLSQTIEAQNLQQLKYGTNSAEKVTLSFWVRSPKTGTHIIELRHHDASLYNSQTYTISSADTWQNVTVTFSGYTTTAINNDNGKGIIVDWILAAGSDFTSGTLSSDTWHNTQANRAVGQVNVVDDAANNFYLTGIQLEVGSQATPFEHLSFGETLSLCQRYYHRIDGMEPSSTRNNWLYCIEANNSGGYRRATIQLPTTMRAVPTVTSTTTHSGGTNGVDAAPWTSEHSVGLWVNGISSGVDYAYSTDFTADAEL